MKRLLGVILALSLFLASCSTPSGNQPVTANPAEITVSVTFPAEAVDASMGAMGVPKTVTKAVIDIFDGVTLVNSLTLTAPTPSGTLTLDAGKTYRFTASAQNIDGTELAWTELIQAVATGDVITLQPTAIVSTAALGPAGYDGTKVSIPLLVKGPTGILVPMSDYEATYAVTGGTISNQNKLGITLLPDSADGSVTVDVTVTGLNSGHTSGSTFPTGKSFVPSALDQGSSYTVNAAVSNWPSTDMWATVRPMVYVDGAGAIPIAQGNVDSSGQLNLTLPGGAELFEAGLMSAFGLTALRTHPNDTTNCTVTWVTDPGSFQYVRVEGMHLYQILEQPSHPSEVWLHGLGLWDSENFYSSQHPTYWYVPQPVTGSGTMTCGSISGSVDLNLSAGWNLVGIRNSSRTGVSISSTPIEYGWYVPVFTVNGYVHNLSAELSASVSSPIVETAFDYLVTFVNIDASVGSAEYYAELNTPSGVTIQSVTFVGGEGTAYPTESVNRLSGRIDYSATSSTTSVSYRVTAIADSSTTGLEKIATLKVAIPNYLDPAISNNTSSATVYPQTESTGGTSVGVAVDLSPPTVTMNDPTNPTVNTLVQLSGTAQDNDRVTSVEVYNGLVSLGAATYDSVSQAWTLDWTPTRTGLFNIKVYAYDPAGNVGELSKYVTVE